MALGIEFLLGNGRGIGIDRSGNADHGVPGPKHLGKHRLDLGGEVVLGLLAVFHNARGGAELRIGFQIFRKHIAGVIHHGHIIELKTLDRVGDQRSDRIHSSSVEFGVAGIDENRGGRARIGGADQQAALGQNHHHTGFFHALHLLDGLGEFALKGAGVVGALDEITDAEIAPVENLKAHASVIRESLRGEVHANAIDILRGHINRRTTAAYLEWDVLLFEDPHHIRRLLLAELPVEEFHVGFLRPVEQGPNS